MNYLKTFFQQHRIAIPVVAFLVFSSLLLSTYNILPFTRWAKHIAPQMAVRVTAVALTATNKSVQISRTGTVESPKSAPVHSEFSGLISEVYVTEGQPVKTDQPLVKILRSSGPSSGREKIDATPEPQVIDIDPQAQTAYDNALKEYNRFQKLYEQNAIAKRQLENAANRLQAAEDNLTAVQTTPPVRASANSAPAATNATIISAPNPGTVVGLAVAPGKTVSLGQPLMILDVGQVQVIIHIEQKDLYFLHPGTPATIEIANQNIPGQVANIFPEVGENNLPSFRTYINVPNNIGGLLKAGMSANVHIDTGKSAAVQTVPAAAVLQDEQGVHYLYLADNGKAIRKEVSIGDTIANAIEITSILPEGSLVITSNINDLHDGDNIVVSQ